MKSIGSPLKSKTKAQIFRSLMVHPILITCIIFCYHSANVEMQKQTNTQEIVANTTTLSKLFYDSGLSIAAYSLTKNQAFIERYNKLITQIGPTIDNLRTLVNKQPAKEINFDEINQLAQKALAELEHAKTLLNNSNLSPLGDDKGDIRSLYKRVKTLADQLQSKLEQLTDAELSLSKNSSTDRQTDQILLTLVFFSYVAFSIRMHLKYLKFVAPVKNSASTGELN